MKLRKSLCSDSGDIFLSPIRSKNWFTQNRRRTHNSVLKRSERLKSIKLELHYAPWLQATSTFWDRSIKPKLSGAVVQGIIGLSPDETAFSRDITTPGIKVLYHILVCGYEMVTTSILTDGEVYAEGSCKVFRSIKDLKLTLDDRDFLNACIEDWLDRNMRR